MAMTRWTVPSRTGKSASSSIAPTRRSSASGRTASRQRAGSVARVSIAAFAVDRSGPDLESRRPRLGRMREAQEPQRAADHPGMRSRFLLALLAAVPAVLPAAAGAATLDANGNAHVYTYRADDGEVNDVAITRDDSGFTIVDTGASAIAIDDDGSAACAPTADGVRCDTDHDAFVKLRLEDLDDVATAHGPVGVRMDGGEGHDVLTGGEGADDLDGAEGDDRLRGGGAADVFTGGAGTDLADFADRLETVRVTPDGVADDGALGEGEIGRASCRERV